MMQKKIDYITGFCKALKYNGLWPMQVVRENENEPYHKDKMICNALEIGKCNEKKCPVFSNANYIVELEKEWILKDKKMT